MPQLHGAALIAAAVVGVPEWTGPVVVAAVVAVTVYSGGMRSITFTQGLQYWVKVFCLLVPLLLMIAVVATRDIEPAHAGLQAVIEEPYRSGYWTISLLVSVLVGTAGLPHVLVRLCTSRDSRAAQQSVALVVVLVGAFYILPVAYGVVGRWYATAAITEDRTDTLVLRLPDAIVGGTPGQLLTAVVAAGAFTTFLATSSGLIITIAGVASQDLFGANVRGFRRAALVATAVALLLALVTSSSRLTETVGHVFALSASTLFPMLALGIWTRKVSHSGAAAGMITGGVAVTAAALSYYALGRPEGAVGDLLAQPGAWSVPLAFTVMLVVSRLRTADPRRAAAVERFLAQIHSVDPSTRAQDRDRDDVD
ncbi:sodium:solute symporter family transporter [Rhodococcus opacus]|uniref:sodium:solute symporter family transporter n=1 Tax=Rhodococcus opacus TaxID=37919 RepID=UPI0029540767|nr:hypothetical protein [Rhodococcus opacus]MDV7090507.1 hypothetical protein [Rhodococcus opacus]